METTKLTLSIPKSIVAEAKVYSRRTGLSLSQLVSRYFSALSKSLSVKAKGNISEKVKSITGLAKSNLSDDALLFESLKEKYR